MSRDQESVAGTKVGFEPEDYAGVQMFGKIRQRCSNDVEMTPADKMFSQHIRNKILEWLCENNEGCRTLNGDVYQSIQGESDLRSAMYKRLSNSHVIWYKSCEPPGLLRASMKWESLGHHEVLVLLEVKQTFPPYIFMILSIVHQVSIKMDFDRNIAALCMHLVCHTNCLPYPCQKILVLGMMNSNNFYPREYYCNSVNVIT